MREVDFLFVYEVKARELENICLLKYELERCGYTVGFINTWYYLDRKVPKYKANVVISFALYNDDTYKFISTYVKVINKIINMQWEQVGSNKEERSEESLYFLEGIAQSAAHICWGNETRDRLKNRCGIDERKLMLTGHISLDFLRTDLLNYYKSKEEIFNKYNIPLETDKKVCLFVSSFSHVNLPEGILTNDSDKDFSLPTLSKISIDSQEEIIKWISSILSRDKDVIFIYRPHPAEANNKKLIELTQKHDNFFVINDLSVKQWIIVCDIIYTWYSTSIIEIYASKKKCHILRPLPIPKDIDLRIYKGATFITDFESFEATLHGKYTCFPIDKNMLSSYYYIDNNEPTYKKICDSFIKVYNDDYFVLPILNYNQKLSFKEKLGTFIKRSYINKILSFISENTKVNIPITRRIRQKKIEGYNSYVEDLSLRNYASEEEIKEIVERIKIVIKKNEFNN